MTDSACPRLHFPHLLACIRSQNRNEEWQTACSSLLAAWEPEIDAMARRYSPDVSSRADFAQVARLTLIRAAHQYRRESGFPFQHYLRRSLRNALVSEARRSRARRRPCQQETTYRSGRRFTEQDGLSALLRQEVQSQVRRRVAGWVGRLRDLVQLLFVEELSQVEAARRMGLTPARINQLFREIQRRGRKDFRDLADILS
ncbi:MAG: hypothetical protein KatS3mg105_2416 [Gemmatales bacterium]|nr:MAG: hypothetical protein KatS3mg105_2416 [Gemmatales bacterium]